MNDGVECLQLLDLARDMWFSVCKDFAYCSKDLPCEKKAGNVGGILLRVILANVPEI